jgi:RNA polymerase sigma-70 factor, ECF subfamily
MDGLAEDILGNPTEGARAADEADAVERARGGDARAFESLYREHSAAVYGLCLRMTASRNQAEELTQETFVRAWRALASFRGESALGSWLHRLAVNVVLEAGRSERRRTARVVPVPDLSGFGRAGTAEPGIAVDLQRALATLPDGARTVFVLHDVEGYRHEEIAAMRGVSTGATKSQLHRARRLLREALG